MTIKTQIVWKRILEDAEIVAINAKAAEYVSAGVADDNLVVAMDTTIGTNATRIWTTTEAANEWVAFLNTFTPPPVSATVIVE